MFGVWVGMWRGLLAWWLVVPAPHEELLNFDKSGLADWDADRAAGALTGKHQAIYRNHLEIAQWIDSWVENSETLQVRDAQFHEGWIKGTREIAAHLRQTDLLPGGALLQDD